MTMKPKARRFRIRRGVPSAVSDRHAGRDGAGTDGAGTDGAGTNGAGTDDVHDTGGAAQGNKAGPLVSDVLSAGGTETAGTAQVQKSAAPPPAVGISAAHLAGGVQTAMLAAPPTQAADAAGPDGLKGLTGRQLRMARRVAQKHGLTVVSDQDAVTQLRARGIDPFQRSSILELVAPLPTAAGDAQVHLPQTMPPQVPKPAPSAQLRENLPSTERIPLAERRAAEIRAVQRDIASRRRRLTLLLFTRLAFFVLLPTILAGWYFYQIATPMYATKSEFIIQQADGQGGSGMGGLFGGTSMGTQQDSMTVQSYLTSRAALLRLDRDHGFKAHFSQPDIDPIQRLPEDASNEAAYKLYQSHVKISYDPTEGIHPQDGGDRNRSCLQPAILRGAYRLCRRTGGPVDPAPARGSDGRGAIQL